MKTYISGLTESPINDVKVKFKAAEKYLMKLNHTPVIPFRNNECTPLSLPVRLEILSDCEALYLLSDWLQSEDSLMEKCYAEIKGKHIMFQSKIENDNYLAVTICKQVLKINGAIQEVTGYPLADYSAGARTTPRYFCRMLFTVHCKESGIEPEDIAFRFIQRDPTTIHYYLKRYDPEFKHNPKFRSIAEQVRQKLQPSKIPVHG